MSEQLTTLLAFVSASFQAASQPASLPSTTLLPGTSVSPLPSTPEFPLASATESMLDAWRQIPGSPVRVLSCLWPEVSCVIPGQVPRSSACPPKVSGFALGQPWGVCLKSHASPWPVSRPPPCFSAQSHSSSAQSVLHHCSCMFLFVPVSVSFVLLSCTPELFDVSFLIKLSIGFLCLPSLHLGPPALPNITQQQHKKLNSRTTTITT